MVAQRWGSGRVGDPERGAGLAAQMSGVRGGVCGSGDRYWDFFAGGGLSAFRAGGGVCGGAGFSCSEKIAGRADGWGLITRALATGLRAR